MLVVGILSVAAFLTMVAAMAVLIIAAWTTLKIRMRHLKKLVRDNEGLVCLQCEYPLIHSHGQGTCPECGFHFHANELPAVWSQALGSLS